jgi:hypothetical protein
MACARGSEIGTSEVHDHAERVCLRLSAARAAARPSHKGIRGFWSLEDGALRTSAIEIRSVPISRFVPLLSVTGRSVVVRTVRQGIHELQTVTDRAGRWRSPLLSSPPLQRTWIFILEIRTIDPGIAEMCEFLTFFSRNIRAGIKRNHVNDQPWRESSFSVRETWMTLG